MNRRLSKKIKKKALSLLTDWVKTQLPEDQIDKDKLKNVEAMLPTDTHVWAVVSRKPYRTKLLLSAWSLKWIIKKIKKLKKDKKIKLENITLKEIEDVWRS